MGQFREDICFLFSWSSPACVTFQILCFFEGYASPTEPSEEEQLKAIWNEVHVGATGFLDRHELALVCDHIGMDSMNDQVDNMHIKQIPVLLWGTEWKDEPDT